jgi:hypothetical protein
MRNQNKITLCDYLANKVPNDCVEVLQDSGYQFQKPRSREELADLLKQYISKDREKALKKLAEIHPDKELCQSIDRPVMDSDYDGNATMRMMGQDYQNPFWSQYNPQNIRQGSMNNGEKHMNACGCSSHMNASGCGCGQMNASGCGCGQMNASGCGKGYSANGGSGCGCNGCKSKSYNNADGSGSTNNLLYLLLGAGFVWFMINLDNKRKYN